MVTALEGGERREKYRSRVAGVQKKGIWRADQANFHGRHEAFKGPENG